MLLKGLIQTSDAPSTIGRLLASTMTMTLVISTKINMRVEDDPIAKERRNWHEYFLHHWCHCCGPFRGRLSRTEVDQAPTRLGLLPLLGGLFWNLPQNLWWAYFTTVKILVTLHTAGDLYLSRVRWSAQRLCQREVHWEAFAPLYFDVYAS